MTLEEIKNSDKAVLTPNDIAPVLRCDPHAIRLTARQAPERLSFPVIVVRTRTKIPRLPFLRYMGVEV